MLVIENLRTNYGAIEALKGISLDVQEGEIVTLIGANGAGKSTTLMSISGAVPAQSGRIIFDGEDITRLPAHEIVRRKIAQAPEGRRIFPRMTVEENLMLGAMTADPHNYDRNRDEVFELFPR
jgi:ABC-type branched-chain amino acid transport systems, ATPase component